MPFDPDRLAFRHLTPPDFLAAALPPASLRRDLLIARTGKSHKSPPGHRRPHQNNENPALSGTPRPEKLLERDNPRSERTAATFAAENTLKAMRHASADRSAFDIHLLDRICKGSSEGNRPPANTSHDRLLKNRRPSITQWARFSETPCLSGVRVRIFDCRRDWQKILISGMKTPYERFPVTLHNNSERNLLLQKSKAIIHLLRPHQYVKNGFIWLPVFFAHKLNDFTAIQNTCYAFVIFCLVASSVYVLNDIIDRESDRSHPVKRERPLAKGILSSAEAYFIFFILILISFSLSILILPYPFLLIIACYIIINIFYSIYLKNIAIIDIFCIATGFVLRVVAGATASNVPVSHWIIIMTFLLAILIALGKRKDDLLISDSSVTIRKSLSGYNQDFISLSMVLMSSVVIVSYILYCVSNEVVQKYNTANLYLTAFWVLLGILRYMQIVFVYKKGGAPTSILLHDYFLWIVIAGWILTFYWLIYGDGSKVLTGH